MNKIIEKIKSFLDRFKKTDQKRIKQQEEFDKKLITKLSKKRIPNFRQLKYLPHFLNKTESRLIQILFGLIIVCLVSLLIRGYFVHLNTAPMYGGEYREGLVGNPQYINPVLSPLNETDQDITSIIYAGLLKYDSTSDQPYRLAPDLAQNYEINDEDKTILFHLRNDILWHDGEKFTAQDVVFTLQTIQNKSYQSPLFSYFKNVEIEKTDDYTVKIKVPEIFSPFLSYLAVGILPQHIWQNIPANQFNLTQYNLKPVGTGPFKFSSLTKNKFGFIKSYTLEKNNKYYSQKPYLDKLIFKFYYSPEDALSALENKLIDGFLAKSNSTPALKKKWINQQPVYLSQYTALFFNKIKITNATVKKALAYGINKQEIIDQLTDPAYPLATLLSSNLVGFESLAEEYNFDPQVSKQLLEQDGWELKDNFYQQEDKQLRVALTVADEEQSKAIAQIIKKQWAEIGVETAIEIIPLSQIYDRVVNSKEYQILLFTIITDLDPDPYPVWHSSQISSGLNLSSFSEDKANKILEKARHLYNPEERNKEYLDFQKLLAEKIPAVYLYNQSYTYLINKRIGGVGEIKIPNFHSRFTGLANWFVQ